MVWNKYPYTDFHELNLDWILSKVQELTIKVTDAIIRIAKNETNIANNSSAIGVLDSSLNSVFPRLDTAEQNITNNSNAIGVLDNSLNSVFPRLDTLESTVVKISPNYWKSVSTEPYIGIPEQTSFIQYICGFDTAGLYAVTVRTVVPNVPQDVQSKLKMFEYYICPGNRPETESFDESKIVRRIVNWDEDRTGNFGDTVTFLYNLTPEVLAMSENGSVNLFLDAFSYNLTSGDNNIPLTCTSYISRILTY